MRPFEYSIIAMSPAWPTFLPEMSQRDQANKSERRRKPMLTARMVCVSRSRSRIHEQLQSLALQPMQCRYCRC